MSRNTFDGEAIDQISEEYEGYHKSVIHEVETAVKSDDFVIVGMAQNPFCRKARKTADTTGKPYKYLEYGSYLSAWKPRLAIKMWSGWPTFPQVFIKGKLVGGAQDLENLIKSGKFEELF